MTVHEMINALRSIEKKYGKNTLVVMNENPFTTRVKEMKIDRNQTPVWAYDSHRYCKAVEIEEDDNIYE